MNKQPFYHSASILFTSTTEVDRDRLTKLLQRAIAKLTKDSRAEIIVESVECEEVSAEPGDPSDLVGK